MTNPSPVGLILAGKYRIERVLGQGGMGIVFAATHIDLLELRAIKMLLPNAAVDSQLVERFLQEARVATRLKSRHVAKVFDFGRLPDGAPYMVMEYLEGIDLATLIAKRGSVPVPNAVHYIIQACDALAEAHEADLVHRDVKPSNLFLCEDEDGLPFLKVLDFGIVKASGGPSMTVAKTQLGTPMYMAPEQMVSARTADARADIWSLGVVLYKLLTGRGPFSGESDVKLYHVIMTETPPPPSAIEASVPPELDAIVLQCLEKDRERRPQTARELAIALHDLTGSLPPPHSKVWQRKPPSSGSVRRAPSPAEAVTREAMATRPDTRGQADTDLREASGPVAIPTTLPSAPGPTVGDRCASPGGAPALDFTAPGVDRTAPTVLGPPGYGMAAGAPLAQPSRAGTATQLGKRHAGVRHAVAAFGALGLATFGWCSIATAPPAGVDGQPVGADGLAICTDPPARGSEGEADPARAATAAPPVGLEPPPPPTLAATTAPAPIGARPPGVVAAPPARLGASRDPEFDPRSRQ